MQAQTSKFICIKHNKNLDILVVNQAQYICEDCAIYSNKYKKEILLEKDSLSSQIQQIRKKCQELKLFQNQNQKLLNKKLCQFVNSIHKIQSNLIDDIMRQFQEIQKNLKDKYLKCNNISSFQRTKNGRFAMIQVQAESIPQKKIKKQCEYKQQMFNYKNFLCIQVTKINSNHQKFQTALQKNGAISIKLTSDFDNLFEAIPQFSGSKNYSKEEDLLDFSEFSLNELKQSKQKNLQTEFKEATFSDSQLRLFKANKVERMKTSDCLEDSVSSISSSLKQNQNPFFNIPAIKNICHNQSLSSERSISCSSVISKALTSATIMNKQVCRKNCIEITTIGELQAKLNIIAPTIKIVRIENIPISPQQFGCLLKEKISKSFIHTLEIVACPKLNQKMLMDLKSYRCKTLKRVEIKQCKQINWADKKVKDYVRKLEADSIKLVS